MNCTSSALQNKITSNEPIPRKHLSPERRWTAYPSNLREPPVRDAGGLRKKGRDVPQSPRGWGLFATAVRDRGMFAFSPVEEDVRELPSLAEEPEGVITHALVA